jgi:hypothetical protein
MARFLFEIPWSFTPGVIVMGVLGTVILVVTVGVLASIQPLVQKPLGVLRAP